MLHPCPASGHESCCHVQWQAEYGGSMTHQVGERIDHYEIVRPLGEGGFAATYLARDERNGQEVVLKWPEESLLGDPTVFEHFRREMAITRKLRHPNIQAAVDAG